MARKEEPLISNAPEGGWGWYVVLAFALNNMVVIPTVQLFGLLYQDLLDQLTIDSVGYNTIIALNCSFGMLLAIFNGPVLRRFGFRKIAVFGVLLIFFGNLLTSQSTTLWHFILFFSIVVSVGMNLAMAAFHLALNSYFVVKRGVAVGIAMSITGIGPIVMPLVVSYLMTLYGIRGSGAIVSAIALHSLIGACLLQPVSWHSKDAGTTKAKCKKIKRKKDNKGMLDDIELGVSRIRKSNDAEGKVTGSDKQLEATDEATPSTKLMDAVESVVSTLPPGERSHVSDDERLRKFLPVGSEVVPSTILITNNILDELELLPERHPNDVQRESEFSSRLTEEARSISAVVKEGNQDDSPAGKNAQNSVTEDEVKPSTNLTVDVKSSSKSENEPKSNDNRSKRKLFFNFSKGSSSSLQTDIKTSKNRTPHLQKNDKAPEIEEEVTPSTRLMDDVESGNSRPKSREKPKSNDESSAPLKSLDDIVRRHEDTVFERIVKFFDFDLLFDPVFVNISLGLSIAFVSEMNFAMMLPFILKERSFDTNRIAVLLSLMAGADIISRFISPFFGQSIKSKVRIVYLVSLMSGIFCRFCFLHTSSYSSTIVVIFALGVTKGIRTVYTALVIPTYVPLPKLASATGLQMVNNGFLFIVFGPLMGFIRKISQDYTNWIHVINCFTACTIIMWFIELYLLRLRKKQKKQPIVIKNEQ